MPVSRAFERVDMPLPRGRELVAQADFAVLLRVREGFAEDATQDRCNCDGAQPYLTLGGDGTKGGFALGAGATSPVKGVGGAISETLNLTLAFDRASVPGASTQAADLKEAAYTLRNHGKLDWRVDAWGLNVGAGASLSPAPSVSLSIGPSLGKFLGAVDQTTTVAP